MTSVGPMSQGMKQTRGYYVPLADCRGFLNSYTAGSGAGGSFVVGTFAVPTASQVGLVAGPTLSSISSLGAGGLLRDMGKTVVSSNRTFRKVQVVTKVNGASSGVGGDSNGSVPFVSGYIELLTGVNVASSANPAPVAYIPGLF